MSDKNNFRISEIKSYDAYSIYRSEFYYIHDIVTFTSDF
jgi:hypothetical protein